MSASVESISFWRLFTLELVSWVAMARLILVSWVELRLASAQLVLVAFIVVLEAFAWTCLCEGVIITTVLGSHKVLPTMLESRTGCLSHGRGVVLAISSALSGIGLIELLLVISGRG